MRPPETSDGVRPINVVPHRGVVPKLFGVVLMALGALDTMLAWRGGLAGGEAYLILLLGGALLFAFGTVLAKR